MIKKYHTLEDASRLSGFAYSDLIHFGATDQLGIFALADDWLVDLYGVDLIGRDGDTGFERGTLVRLSQSPYPIRGPVQLYTEAMARFEANPDALADRFIAALDDDTDAEFDAYEYQLVQPSETAPRPAIVIGKCKLVVFEQSVQELLASKKMSDDRPLETRERNTLYSIFAALACMSKIDLTKTSKAATVIQNQVELMGGQIAARTIEGHINKIAAELRTQTRS